MENLISLRKQLLEEKRKNKEIEKIDKIEIAKNIVDSIDKNIIIKEINELINLITKIDKIKEILECEKEFILDMYIVENKGNSKYKYKCGFIKHNKYGSHDTIDIKSDDIFYDDFKSNCKNLISSSILIDCSCYEGEGITVYNHNKWCVYGMFNDYLKMDIKDFSICVGDNDDNNICRQIINITFNFGSEEDLEER